jgi:hypothetical protein
MPNGIEPRVATLESFVKGLDDDIRALSVQVGRTADDTRSALQRQYDVIERQGASFNAALSSLQQTVNRSGHTEWSTLASWAAVVVVVCGTVGSLYVQPVKDAVTANESRHDNLALMVNENNRAIAASDVRFAEVETQFKASKELEQMRHELAVKDSEHLRELIDLRHVKPRARRGATSWISRDP